MLDVTEMKEIDEKYSNYLQTQSLKIAQEMKNFSKIYKKVQARTLNDQERGEDINGQARKDLELIK